MNGTPTLRAAVLWAAAFTLALLAWASPTLSDSFSTRFDADIRKAVKQYWADYPDWIAWKAQLFQESRLDPDAVSPVGARGLAQFMPGTWTDVMRAMGDPHASPHEASLAIEAGAYYMARLRRGWSSPRPVGDRENLARASYNAGMGNLLKAQRACGGALLWPPIAACLQQVTGHHAQETLTYVERIKRWAVMMKAGIQ